MPDQHFHPGDRVLVSSPGGAVFHHKPGVVVTEEYADSQYDGTPSCCMVEIEGMTGPLSIPLRWLTKTQKGGGYHDSPGKAGNEQLNRDDEDV